METQPDFRDLLKLFNAHNVDYLIVGGYALAFHGASMIFPDNLTMKLQKYEDVPPDYEIFMTRDAVAGRRISYLTDGTIKAEKNS